mgnify:CR=1 FL=1
MERWLLSQITSKILRCADKQGGLTPVQFSRVVLGTRQWQHLRQYIPVANDIAEGVTATAEVWQGGWVVPCPLCGTGLEDGDPENPLFLCCSCWNSEVGGKILVVQYPPNWRAIETELLKRPKGKTRGWLRNETLKNLQDENKAIGVT